MEFQVVERMMLLSLLSSAEGDVTMLRIVRDTQEKLGFSEEDREALGLGPPCVACSTLEVDHPDESECGHKFTPSVGQVAWRQGTSANVKEVDLGKAAHKLISERLLSLSVQKKLTMNQLALYERFVEEEEQTND